ncbi:MAG: sensor signal transduction histidine kinase [Verrucomicrobia bacterium]|nr:sensor signal transduction histidine kinase [Verrucomicrobiota bacterium]
MEASSPLNLNFPVSGIRNPQSERPQLADSRALPALYRLTSLAGRADDPRAALREVLDEFIATFGADAGSIALVNPHSGRLEIEVEQGLPDTAGSFGLKLGHGVTGWCVLNSKALLVPDVSVEPRYIAVRPAARAEMAAPMGDGETIIGVIDLESDRTGHFTPADLVLLERLTQEATQIVQQLWRMQALQAKARQLETLLTTGQSLVAKLESQELLDTLACDARRMLQASACALYLHDPVRDSLRFGALDAPSAPPLPMGDLPTGICIGAAALHTQKQVEFADVRSVDFDGIVDLPKDAPLHAALLTPLLFEGEVLGVLAVFTDQAHRFDNDEKRVCSTLASLGAVALQNARLYARVFKSEETLRKQEQLTTLGLLAAEIAHEIRNPLTVLKLLHGGLGLDFPPTDPRRTDVRVISEKLDQLESIVTRVLNFAKAPSSLHSRWALADIIGDTLVLVRPKLSQGKIHLLYEPTSQPLVVEANKGQLQQVLLNLLLNAMQAMPDGGAIALSVGLGDDAHASIDVADTGTGIPEAVRGRIFDSFFSGRPDGTGLGLAIAKRILQAHHGDIALVSTGPGGTTMRISLPLAKS